MAIDPTHLPIFGDVEPNDPPAPIRAASVLLLINVALTAAHLAVVTASTDHDVSLALLPICLAVAFALGIRGGRDWARVASLLVAGLALLLMLGVAEGVLGVTALVLSTVLVLAAGHLMYRSDVRDYFGLPDNDSDTDDSDTAGTEVAPDGEDDFGGPSADAAPGTRTPRR
ncbi:hypothetical protein [Actinokineospora diospyrosa]|uniref:Uncharacterized protein n=1 Tax=Actinokineospora diospyrosa TaxID=103728 RepID=A0ABT1IE21_9PSEU|nr:hypothetical protein [Actinokineospora diospyrosa]MCP2270896.1 hypothetical protein [Actinokineospora diospyrosa]